jgi:hypothetical protein
MTKLTSHLFLRAIGHVTRLLVCLVCGLPTFFLHLFRPFLLFDVDDLLSTSSLNTNLPLHNPPIIRHVDLLNGWLGFLGFQHAERHEDLVSCVPTKTLGAAPSEVAKCPQVTVLHLVDVKHVFETKVVHIAEHVDVAPIWLQLFAVHELEQLTH